MVISIEPGFYKAGDYGMRIENLVFVEEDGTRTTSQREFYRFRNLTLCPVSRKLVDKSLMTAGEVSLLDSYHRSVWNKLYPHLGQEQASWLQRATLPL